MGVQRELGISSALHLGALERAGFLTRVRSEADRRRTYLRLTPGAFDGLLPTPALAARRVVFVCTGNSARSQLAAALWRQASAVPATSAGTHPAERVEPGVIAAAERHGLNIADATPQALDGVIEGADLVVTVCDGAHEELGAAGRVHWSVPDPMHEGTDAAFEDIAARIGELLPRVTTC